MTITNTNGHIRCLATLVAPQGSWKWQKRLRLVEYRPVVASRRSKYEGFVWGDPRELNDRVSGGNLRSSSMFSGEASPYRRGVPESAWTLQPGDEMRL